MSAVSIIAKWYPESIVTTEVITLDIDRLKEGEQVTWTTESWDDGPKSYHYRYKTSSEFEPDESGGGRLTIYYREEDSPHLKDLGIYWGYSVFELDSQMKGGKVEFFCTSADMDDGYGNKTRQSQTEWKAFSVKDSKPTERERETIERFAREQTRFRKRLMMIDPKCAITGECEPSALEAAHILSVKSNGADIDSNGLMLRADLHRLFDSKLFNITAEGIIEISEDLKSEEYRSLQGKSIDGMTLARIGDALRRKAQPKHR